MWRHLAKYFNAYPKRRILAQKLLEYGLKINKNKIYCGEIELSDAKIARAFNIDRRIIADTVKTINKEKVLQKVFFKLEPTCHLKDVAPEMEWGVIEIIPENPRMPGILSNVAKVVSDANIIIRQAIVDDFELSEEPRLFIVVEKQVPGNIIPDIKQIKGVKAVVIY